MKEEFLHYLWKYGLYYKSRLCDAGGNKIIVIKPGEYNRDSGPDFFNARVSINDTIWAGNIEIHTRSSHFDSHGHQNDPAFDNVILHVVAVNDKKVFNSKGEELLTVELAFDPLMYTKYEELISNPCTIACQNEIRNIESIHIHQWLNTLAVERLKEKSDQIMKIYGETGNDWEETFYRILSRYFGFRVNTEPFEMLARNIPFKVIRKHADNRFQIEALLFGTAGMLEEGLFKGAVSDSYFSDLQKEYKILSSKYSLIPVHGKLWKFSRLRPVNFPTVRISQLSQMLTVSGGLFSRVLETGTIKEIKALFEVSASGYWNDHYVFGKKSRFVSKKTGSQATDILIINAIIPVIFVYGLNRGMPEFTEKALDLLDNIDPEVNLITTEWEKAGINLRSSLFTQALIQLRNEYCRRRKCLDCRIGSKLICQGKVLKSQSELLLEP